MPAQFRAIPLLAVFGLVSLASILAGVAICSASGVPLTLGLRNIAAWAIGAVIAAIIAFTARRTALPVFLWLLPVGLLASFLSPGLEGVHRWLAFGPVQANVAMLLGPAAVVAFAARMDFWPTGSWLALLAALALTVAQPDASQASALAAVAVLAAWSFHARPRSRLILVALAIGAAVWAWQRPDPLAPVPEVEGVIGLAFAQSVSMGALALSLMILTAVAPTLAATTSAARLPALSLGLFLLAWAAAPFLGAFPVPFLGIGPSPIVGAWLGVGLLAALLRDQAAVTAA
ncbi:hypothetical protein [Caulobacter sp. NIBR1757]|uniref:hypothetical protein n=1 Tax=Caulobacter sp. NIBR1757 TaxID=3016000 RepID=UPI0022F00F06|nr:hypothetical protein [Caulobacter sp. NIBR1757]WGM39783.1 hypothetical protein AMEJIAPC_02710 [Caulobacter sp. NIBR1757]